MPQVLGRDCVLGIDVSRWQGRIDWPQVAACRQFAYIKASGGDGGVYTDPTYAGNVAASAGLLPRGAYHFLGTGDGAAQADRFLDATGGYPLELPPAVDFEPLPGGARPTGAVLAGFVDRLHERLGRRWVGPTGQPVACLIYTGASMAGRVPDGYDRFDLWHAAYMNGSYPRATDATAGAAPAVDQLPSPNRYVIDPWRARGWSLWQFAGEDGRVPGVAGGCDQNVATVEWFTRTTGTPPTTEEDDVGHVNSIDDEAAAAIAAKVQDAVSGVAAVQGHDWGRREQLHLDDLATKLDVLQVGINIVALVTKAVADAQTGGNLDEAKLAGLLADELAKRLAS